MKILVTGASGQVGAELRKSFKLKSSVAPGAVDLAFTNRTELDFVNTSQIKSVLTAYSPDFIVNAAAYTAVDRAESEEDIAFTVNSRAVETLAEYCCENECRLIHISTDYVFDGKADGPYSECDDVCPESCYGRSKTAGEELIRLKLPEHIILRTSWVFGSTGSNFVKTMLKLAQSQDEVRIVADQTGGPTAAAAIADTIVSIIGQMKTADRLDRRWGTYHFSGLPYVSWADFANEIFDKGIQRGLISVRPSVIEIPSCEYITPAERPMNSRLNNTKIARTFDVPKHDWASSVELVLDELARKDVE